ncbi:MAG: hypothetical protein HN350_20965 [Phycisphaerales bacterium]|jgi:hypothetical protein|nr:hypothetical protein [Phycisphaerales bacterium]
MENCQSIVLLTTGKPQLAVENIIRRLTRWTNCQFSKHDDESENFVTLSPTTGIIKLGGEFMFTVTILERSYFDTEDAQPYLEQAELSGDNRLAGLLQSCSGAILIDAHIITQPYKSILYLAKIAAAMMEQDTPVMLVPPSLVVREVSGELRSAMGRATDATELMPHMMNFSAEPNAQGDQVTCLTFGMHMLALPNVIMRCGLEQQDIEQCAEIVQSIASYMVDRRQAMPIGDTTEVANGNLGILRVVHAEIDNIAQDPQDAIALEPTISSGSRIAAPTTPPGAPTGELGDLAQAVTKSKPRVARINARKKRAAAKQAAIGTGILIVLFIGGHAFKNYLRKSAQDYKSQAPARKEEMHRKLENSANEVRDRLQRDLQTPAAPGSPEETARQYWLKAQKARKTATEPPGTSNTAP